MKLRGTLPPSLDLGCWRAFHVHGYAWSRCASISVCPESMRAVSDLYSLYGGDHATRECIQRLQIALSQLRSQIPGLELLLPCQPRRML
ncbi:hypothetical protein E2C01_095817 [Portunus trituberculatus]|uniref:Uncharacterized protein n=1 Tax=Portunus trituberculatus TaxID=210409 RepID=A0A5B7JU09_PORTR|nr:hypothetical protein [Portunus trituberculatus]